MVLTSSEIKKELGKNIIIDPFDEKQLGANSYNLRLDNELIVYKEGILDMKKPLETETIIIPEDGLVLKPGELYLGKTIEYTETKKHSPFLEGRSSTARLGLFVHISAGFGNVGSSGCWTLELTCIKPLKIYPRVEICQIYYQMVYGEIEKGKSHYHGSKKVMPSLMYKELEEK